MFFKGNTVWFLTIFFVGILTAAQCSPASSQPAASAQNETERNEATTNEHDHVEAKHTELTEMVLGPGEKLRVVATSSIVADMVKNVGGDLIALEFLLPLGSDPHSFQATPQDIAKVAQAHVLFANGLGLEEFLSELMTNAGGQAAVVALSEGVATGQMAEAEMAADEHGSAEHSEDEHAHAGTDPHTWTTPANAIIFVQNIEKALSALDPANAATYQSNAKQYQGQLKELDDWVKAQIEQLPAENRKLVTDHTVFGYYAERYGLAQVGAVMPAFSTASEPSAQELAALEQIIIAQRVKAIFVGNTVNPGLEQRVTEDTGLKLVTLFTESLGPAGSGAETYVEYTRYNTTAIVEALK
jgi:ABC-type Zn uptake system ZnuABC Zn-binding protein ZnuA